MLIASIGICTLFCSTVVYSGVGALKGAYEDLAEARLPSREDEPPGVNMDEDYNAQVSTQDEDDDGDETATKLDVGVEVVQNNMITDTESLLQENEAPHATIHPEVERPLRGRVGSQSLTCLMKVCQAWYIVTIVSTMIIMTLTFYCFPRMPQYNLCSDELAWKSIISGLTSLKMEASFELLVSIENKNHLGIVLESFGGKFSHDGGEVGTFTVPQSTLPATSITDVLVICTVVPNKWEALGLIAEYYKGSLILSMSVNGAVKVTGIDYSFPVKETDVIVRVNDPSLADRHLCACPEWKDVYPSMAPIPEFLRDNNQNSTMVMF